MAEGVLHFLAGMGIGFFSCWLIDLVIRWYRR